jgi:hypothetical protein
MKTNYFDFVTLMLVFDFFENFNVGYIFWMECTRTSIFHMIVPCVKVFLWVHIVLTVTLNLVFDICFESQILD